MHCALHWYHIRQLCTKLFAALLPYPQRLGFGVGGLGLALGFRPGLGLGLGRGGCGVGGVLLATLEIAGLLGFLGGLGGGLGV